MNQPRSIDTTDFLLSILVLVPLFFLPITLDVFNTPKQWLFVCLTMGLLVHYSLRTLKLKRKVGRQQRLTSLALLFSTVCILISAVFSETSATRALFGYPGRANGILTYLALFSLVWVASRVDLPLDFDARLKKSLLIVYFLFALYSTIQWLDLDPFPWNNPYNPIIGTLGNPNFAGAFLGTSSLVMFSVLRRVSKFQRYVFIGLASASLFVAYSTESIQAIGIFAVGLALKLLIVLYRKVRKLYFISLVTLMALFSATMFLSMIGLGPFGEKLFEYTLRLRLEYWRVGLEIAQHFPITGVGPDSYVEGFRLFRGQAFVEKYTQSVIADSAHNVLINFMANFGIPAFLSLLLLVILISIQAIRILFSEVKEKTSSQMIAMSWLLLLIQSLFSLEQIGLNVFQWCCGALLLNSGLRSHEQSEISTKSQRSIENLRMAKSKGLSTEFAVLVTVLSMGLSWSLMKQEIGLRNLGSTVVDRTISDYKVHELFSGFNSYTLGEVRRAIYATDFLVRAEKYEQANQVLKAVLDSDPDAYEALEQLSRLANYNSQINDEIKFRKLIEVKDPYNYGNYLAIARAYQALNKREQAKFYAKKVLELSQENSMNDSATEVLELEKEAK